VLKVRTTGCGVNPPDSLARLGWQTFFQQQLTLDEWEQCLVARVFRQERSLLEVLTADGGRAVPLTPNMPPLTVGDWIVLDREGRFQRLLGRLSVFSRKAAGKAASVQLIAANVDTVFIVCSLNQDFNLNRIERYLVLANQAQAEPVVVLSKKDTCDDPDGYIARVAALDPLLAVLAVNCLEAASAGQLEPWCREGRTVAFLGSSGVGKSTLINSLSGEPVQKTSSIRAGDDKGRHTTTGRSLHLMASGGLLLDTPGMREIQLADCETGVEETFAEITELARSCRFADCRHQDEPGCRVQQAIADGTLDERRLNSYRKLLREQAFNEATLEERRSRDRKLGRFYRSVLADKRRFKGDS
jgi:ribosome biogenesis GTPase